MLATSATRPARLSETMRRVRLEKESAKKNCPARRNQPSGRRQPLSPALSSATRSRSGSSEASSWFRLESGCVRSSNGQAAGFDAPLCRFYAFYAERADVSVARPPAERRSGFLEAIADAVQRLDHLEVVVDDLELLAQPLDVAVDGAVVDIDLVVIGRIHQRVAAFHHTGPRRQRLQDQEFGHGERHRLVLPGAGMTFRIHPQKAAVERARIRLLRHGGRILGLAAAEHGLDAFDQQALRE